MSERIYGIHAVDNLLRRSPERIIALNVQHDRKDKRMQSLLELAANQGVSVKSLSKRGLDDLVSDRHQGVVAEIRGGHAATDITEAELLIMLESIQKPLLLVLDGVTDPHNLGACLRSADAAGVQAVITPKDNSAELNAAARKVASGAAESIPLIRVTNLARTLESLKQHGIWLIGTAGDAEQSLYQQDFTMPCALVMGAEGAGMRRLTREACDFLVHLPMAGDVSSLNVSVATGVCLFEAVRQRS